MILNKEHVADKRVDCLLEINITTLLLATEEDFNGALSGELWFHGPDVIMLVLQEGILYIIYRILAIPALWFLFLIITEGADAHLDEFVIDKWFGHELLLETKAVALNLAWRHWQGWTELTQQTVNRMSRDLPDAEEAKDMVYAISREVFLHLAETLEPPAETILLHLVPVVGREAPVLAIG